MTINKKGVFTKEIKYTEMIKQVSDLNEEYWVVYKGQKHVATINTTNKVIYC